MYIINIGLSYKKTPIKLREKLVINDQKLTEMNQRLNREKSIFENVIISTCNRTEVYAIADQLHTGRYYLKRFFSDVFALELAELEPYLVVREEREAVQHAFAVICGLDSMVIGETQILGQFKKSFLNAQTAGTTGTMFDHLFMEMIRFAKAVHTKYRINDQSASLSNVALQQAKETLGPLENKKLFVLGAGEMAEMVIKNAKNYLVTDITIFNRTPQRAERLRNIANCPLTIHPLADFFIHLNEAEIIVSALGIETPFITKKRLADNLSNRKSSLFLADLGVPRTIDLHCKSLPLVILRDVDDLYHQIEHNQNLRKELALQIAKEINEATDAFYRWQTQLGIVPVIKKIRQKTLLAEETAMASLANKMPDLSDRERKIIRKHMKSIVNQALRTPIKEIKEIAVQEDAQEQIEFVKRLFGLADGGNNHDENNQSRDKSKQTGAHSNKTGPYSDPTTV